MDLPDVLTPYDTHNSIESNDAETLQNVTKSSNQELLELQQQMIANFQKPNVPNVNVPERIIICLDVCYGNSNSLYRLGDGTTFTPMNMTKHVLNFFLHSKNAINMHTEFALVTLKDTEACWIQNFTSNVKDITNALDYVNVEESTTENFDFMKLLQLLKSKVEIPECEIGNCIQAPPFVVRMIVLFGRSNSIPLIPYTDTYFIYLKKQLYFYIDILLAHEEDCAKYKCEEIYDSLQDLDDGYSYVFEVSRNATKIHDCVAKLLAHPLQRPLQKNTDYSFGCRY